jgi:hypothetical protein
LLRYPRSKPICATRPVSEHAQPHMRSPLIAAAPRSRFRRAGLRKTRTILESGISGHGLLRFIYLDPSINVPFLITSRGEELVISCLPLRSIERLGHGRLTRQPDTVTEEAPRGGLLR